MLNGNMEIQSVILLLETSIEQVELPFIFAIKHIYFRIIADFTVLYHSILFKIFLYICIVFTFLVYFYMAFYDY